MELQINSTVELTKVLKLTTKLLSSKFERKLCKSKLLDGENLSYIIARDGLIA